MRNRLLWIFLVILAVGGVLYGFGIRLTRENLVISAAAEPVFCLGGMRSGTHCASGFPITNSLIMTVIVDVLLILTILFGVRKMQFIPRGFQNIVEMAVEAFYNFAQGVDRKNALKFLPVSATILFFVLYSNLFALLPGVGSIGVCVPSHAATTGAHAAAPAGEHAVAPAGEQSEQRDFFATWWLSCPQGSAVLPILRSPSADLNVTLAFALVAVGAVEFFGFQALGLGYLTKFFNFRGFRTSVFQGVLDLFIGLIELLSEFVRIIAFAFRLFGNIFAGEVVLVVMSFLFPYLLPLPFYGLELFVALIQAIIFAVLTLVFMSLAVQAHGD